MKFSASFSALLVVVSFIAGSSALAVPEDALVARARGGQANQQQAAAQAAAAKAAAAKAAAAKGGKATTAAAKTTAAASTATAVAGQTNNAAAATGGADAQSSTTLDPSVIQLTGTGQDPPVAGQSSALVSQNNFINFCKQTLPGTPLTAGLQTTSGSCNPVPIGLIPSTANIPASKFQNPKNMDVIAANTAFNVSLAVKNIQIGDFTNAQQTYFANPQTLNAQGQIIGHTHIVIEAIDSLTSTTVTDPLRFTFFKGVDDPANGQGIVNVPVTAGVPAGFYRMGTIMSSSSHQPVIVPIAQHGLCDDVVYFQATAGGAAAGNNAGGAAAAAGGGAAAAGGGAAAAAGNGKAAATTAAAATKAAAATQAAAAGGKGAAKGGAQAAKGGAKKAGKGRPRAL